MHFEAKSVKDVLFVEETVSGGFGKMLGTDVWFSCQVGDGAGELDDAGTSPGRKTHTLDDALQQFPA